MATNELLKQGTLLDVLNNRAPDGNLLVVAEVLQKETPIIKDAPWVEANDLQQHIYSRRTKLPTSEILKFNKGVGGNRGATEQVTSGIQARGNWPSYDARLVDMSPNRNIAITKLVPQSWVLVKTWKPILFTGPKLPIHVHLMA